MLVECLYHLSHEASMNRLGFLTWCPMRWIFCHSVPDYFVISWYIFLHTFVSVLFFLWIHPPRHVFWWRESRKLLGSTRRSAYLKLLLCAGEVWHTERITLRNTAPEKKGIWLPWELANQLNTRGILQFQVWQGWDPKCYRKSALTFALPVAEHRLRAGQSRVLL